MNYSQSYEKFVNGAIDTTNVLLRDYLEKPKIRTLTAAPVADLFNILGVERANCDTHVYQCDYALVSSKESIYSKGQQFSSVYIVASGTAKTTLTQESREVVDEIFLPGEILGLEDLDRPVYRKTAVATSDLLLLQVSEAELIRMINALPKLKNVLLEILSQKTCRNQFFRKILAEESDEIKLSMLLYNLAIRIGTYNQPATVFDLPLNRQDLATYLSIKPSKLNYVFRKFHDEGIAKMEANSIKIHQILRLQEIWNSFFT
jgi:CRP/FNR family transcriptional regulator